MSRFHLKGWAAQRLCFTQDGQMPRSGVPSLSLPPHSDGNPTCYCQWLPWGFLTFSGNVQKPSEARPSATPEPGLRKKGTGPYRTSVFVGAKKEEGEKWWGREDIQRTLCALVRRRLTQERSQESQRQRRRLSRNEWLTREPSGSPGFHKNVHCTVSISDVLPQIMLCRAIY